MVPALIDQATFDAATAALQSGKGGGGRPPLDEEATWLRGHVTCGCCFDRMYVRRADNGYKYECRNRRGVSTTETHCPGGDFSIRPHMLDQYAYAALTQAAKDLDKLRNLMLQRLGYDKVAALESMAEAYAARLQEKTEKYERTRRLATQVDEAVATDLLKDAASLKAEIAALEKEYAQAREGLEEFSSGSTWVDATIARIKASLPTDNPTEQDIRDMSLEDRRFLLDGSGFSIAVYPVGYPKRAEAVFLWGDPAARKLAHVTLRKLTQTC